MAKGTAIKRTAIGRTIIPTIHIGSSCDPASTPNAAIPTRKMPNDPVTTFRDIAQGALNVMGSFIFLPQRRTACRLLHHEGHEEHEGSDNKALD